jgi:hypothetical protein
MLKIELIDYGLEDTLKKISSYLESAIKSKHKKQKDALMNKALGAIETLYYIINVEEVNTDVTDESSE